MNEGKMLEQELYDLYQARKELDEMISTKEEELCLYYCARQIEIDRAREWNKEHGVWVYHIPEEWKQHE